MDLESHALDTLSCQDAVFAPSPEGCQAKQQQQQEGCSHPACVIHLPWVEHTLTGNCAVLLAHTGRAHRAMETGLPSQRASLHKALSLAHTSLALDLGCAQISCLCSAPSWPLTSLSHLPASLLTTSHCKGRELLSANKVQHLIQFWSKIH